MAKSELTDRQWDKIKPHLPRPKKSRRKGGRPPSVSHASQSPSWPWFNSTYRGIDPSSRKARLMHSR